MKEIYTPYVRPDGIIVGIKGKAPEKPERIDMCESGMGIFYAYEKDTEEFIQSGHPFEDQDQAFLLCCNPMKDVTPELLPPIELDVKEVDQYQSKFDGEWRDRLYRGENLPAPPDTVIRTILRIAKEEQRPTNPQAETDCKCGSDSPGWTEVKCCNLCGKSVEAFWSQPTEEATETQEELWDNVGEILDLTYDKGTIKRMEHVQKQFTIQRKPK